MFTQDHSIYGKHATKLKFLAQMKDEASAQDSKEADIYERYMDVYMNAAVFGLLYDHTAPRDNDSKDRARLGADVVNREHDNLILLFRTVMLLDNTTNLTPDERIDRAFRFDSEAEESEEFKNNMELFESYVRGGIDEMYKQFTDGCTEKGDYLKRINEIMKSFNEEVYEKISFEDKLKEFLT